MAVAVPMYSMVTRDGTPNGCLRQILNPTKLGAHHTSAPEQIVPEPCCMLGASLLMVVPEPRLPEIPSRAPSTTHVPRAEEQTTKYQVDRDDKEGVWGESSDN